MTVAKSIPQLHGGDVLEFLKQQPDKSFHLAFTSPPYPWKGMRYGGTNKLKTEPWVTWMLEVVTEAVRVTSGMVFLVANNAVRNTFYEPATELLLADWYRQGGRCRRTVIWEKNSAPSGQVSHFHNTYETVLGFCNREVDPGFDWQAVAKPPTWTAGTGGNFRQRDPKGKRRSGKAYPQVALARPRDMLHIPSGPPDYVLDGDSAALQEHPDVLRVPVGGGMLGHKLAHEQAAPFPERLVEPFVKSYSRPGQRVLDFFSGSGTTLAVAYREGREGVGVDADPYSIDLARRRLSAQFPELSPRLLPTPRRARR